MASTHQSIFHVYKLTFYKVVFNFLCLADIGHGPRRKYANETFLTFVKGLYTNFIYRSEESWTFDMLICTSEEQKGTNLTFRRTCIVIYAYNKTNEMH